MSRRRWLPALAAGLAAAALVPAAWWAFLRADEAGAYDEALRAAKARLDAGAPAEARDLLAEVSGRWPGRGEAELLLGACEQALGRPDRAAEAWALVPDDSPFAGPAAMYRARVALAGDRLAEAEESLPTALRAEGRLGVEARETLLFLLKLQGRFDEARRLVRDGWEHYPDRVGTLQQLWRLEGPDPIHPEEQRTVVERAFASAPDDDRVWLAQAAVERRRNRLDDADRWLDACLGRRPDDPAVWKAKLDLAQLAQDEDGALEALRRLPPDRLDPRDLLATRVWFAARAGDDARERAALAELLEHEPGAVQAVERLAGLEQQAGRPDEAARLRDRKAELDRAMTRYMTRLFEPDPAADAPTLAEGAEAIGRPFDARCWWELAARRNPRDTRPAAEIARLDRARAGAPAPPRLPELLAELEAAPRRSLVPWPDADGHSALDFVDAAEEAGLRFTYQNGATPRKQMPETMGGGVALLDFDRDGWVDVYCVQGGTFPSPPGQPCADRLFRNRGDGTFEDATEAAGIAAMPGGYGHGVAVGDVDNDGFPDLFITRWRSYALYRNRGDGTFEDVTEPWGLGGDRDWPTSAAFADLDGDGDLDLYVCHYLAWDAEDPPVCDDRDGAVHYCKPQLFPALPDHLFRNDGGRFADVSDEAGITSADVDGRGLGVVACDLDGDGRLDLYVANDTTANFLFRNEGGMRFREVGHEAGVAASGVGGYQAGMGVALGDVDGDGRPDLAVANFYSEGTTLYQNIGGGIFNDRSAASGLLAATRDLLGFGLAFLDADNDGRLDLAGANGHVDDFRPNDPYQMPARILVGRGDGRLVDASDGAGPPWQVPRVGRALAVGDLDNDGRPDLVLVGHDGPLAYFRNRTPGGRWLTLGLQEADSGRDAVGARVRVEAGGRTITSWKVGGGSYQSASGSLMHIGLGECAAIDRVEITWPSGRVDTHRDLPVDVGLRIVEGEAAPSALAGYRAGP